MLEYWIQRTWVWERRRRRERKRQWKNLLVSKYKATLSLANACSHTTYRVEQNHLTHRCLHCILFTCMSEYRRLICVYIAVNTYKHTNQFVNVWVMKNTGSCTKVWTFVHSTKNNFEFDGKHFDSLMLCNNKLSTFNQYGWSGKLFTIIIFEKKSTNYLNYQLKSIIFSGYSIFFSSCNI